MPVLPSQSLDDDDDGDDDDDNDGDDDNNKGLSTTCSYPLLVALNNTTTIPSPEFKAG